MSSIEYRVRVSVVAELGDEQVFLTDQQWTELGWGLGNARHLVNGILGDEIRATRQYEQWCESLHTLVECGRLLVGESWGTWNSAGTCNLEVQVISVTVEDEGEYLGER